MEEDGPEHTRKNSILQDFNDLQPLAGISPSRCVISLNSPVKILWDILIAISVLIEAFLIPVHCAFLNDSEHSVYIENYLTLSKSLYCLDIVVTFMTSYIDSATQHEVTKLKVIAANYIKGRFFLDVLSVLPIWIFDNCILH